jgi:hypothetical protein
MFGGCTWSKGRLEDKGVDVIVVQGSESRAHWVSTEFWFLASGFNSSPSLDRPLVPGDFSRLVHFATRRLKSRQRSLDLPEDGPVLCFLHPAGSQILAVSHLLWSFTQQVFLNICCVSGSDLRTGNTEVNSIPKPCLPGAYSALGKTGT